MQFLINVKMSVEASALLAVDRQSNHCKNGANIQGNNISVHMSGQLAQNWGSGSGTVRRGH